MSFLDKTGLAHLWNQIIARLNGKANTEDVNEAKTQATNAETVANQANTAVADKAPMYSYGTEDLEAGVSELPSGTLYFVYE